MKQRALVATLAAAIALLAAGDALAQPTPQPAPQDHPVTPPPVQGEVALQQTFTPDQPREATVGDVLTLTLQITHPGNTTVALPDALPTGRFELLRVDREPLPPQRGPAPVTETLHLRAAVYRPGRHVLQPLQIRVLDARGGVSTLTTQPVEVVIRSVIANDEDPQMPPHRPPVSIEVEDWTLASILGGSLALLLAGALGALIYRRLAPRPLPPPPPPRPAYDVAIEKLLAIKAADLIQEDLIEELYVRVSEAVREYLGRRYNLSLTDKAGLELTTWELMALLREVRWPRGLTHADVETLLTDCDMVKFARYTPPPQDAEDLLTRAFRLVELTRPLDLGQAALASAAAPRTPEAQP